MSIEHDDVEFAVNDCAGNQRIFRDFDQAAGLAIAVGASGHETYIDVLIYSKAGAMVWGGSDAVESYMEDPDASVFERIEIKVNSVGRIR